MQDGGLVPCDRILREREMSNLQETSSRNKRLFVKGTVSKSNGRNGDIK